MYTCMWLLSQRGDAAQIMLVEELVQVQIHYFVKQNDQGMI